MRASVGPCHRGDGATAPGGFQAAADGHLSATEAPSAWSASCQSAHNGGDGETELKTTNSQIYQYRVLARGQTSINERKNNKKRIKEKELRTQRDMRGLWHELKSVDED